MLAEMDEIMTLVRLSLPGLSDAASHSRDFSWQHALAISSSLTFLLQAFNDMRPQGPNTPTGMVTELKVDSTPTSKNIYNRMSSVFPGKSHLFLVILTSSLSNSPVKQSRALFYQFALSVTYPCHSQLANI